MTDACPVLAVDSGSPWRKSTHSGGWDPDRPAEHQYTLEHAGTPVHAGTPAYAGTSIHGGTSS